jgi:hypothetical protein
VRSSPALAVVPVLFLADAGDLAEPIDLYAMTLE